MTGMGGDLLRATGLAETVESADGLFQCGSVVSGRLKKKRS